MDKETFSLFDVLEQKNSYLLEFHKINMEELNRLAEGSLDNLENFYYSREILLNAISKLDHKLSTKEWDKPLKMDKEKKKKLLDIFYFKRKMVMSILDQDLVIISLVDRIKKNKPAKAIAS